MGDARRSRVVFMGTPWFAVPTVRMLAGHPACELVGVVCQPDKKLRRHKTEQPPPVKVVALEAGIEVLQPRRLASGPFPERLAELRPDLAVVASYGRILPPPILAIPRLGCVNIHPSLLPRWRGAAPIQWTIAAGDAMTGVCLMAVDEGLDTGAILARTTSPVLADDTGESLHDRLAVLGAELLHEHLGALFSGVLEAAPQAGDVTHAPILTREDGRLSWSSPAQVLANRIRAFFPWPGAFTVLAGSGRVVKLFPPVEVFAGQGGEPGTVVAAEGGSLTVACGQGLLGVREVQIEGKKRMAVGEALRGLRGGLCFTSPEG